LRVADNHSVRDPAQPAIAHVGVGMHEPAFDESEMPAQQLRQVRVRLAELDHYPEELWQGRAEPAVRARHAYLPEPGLAQPAHLVVRKRAAGLAVERPLRDLGEYGTEPLRQPRRFRGICHA
jgi:hypothetical protein